MLIFVFLTILTIYTLFLFKFTYTIIDCVISSFMYKIGIYEYLYLWIWSLVLLTHDDGLSWWACWFWWSIHWYYVLMLWLSFDDVKMGRKNAFWWLYYIWWSLILWDLWLMNEYVFFSMPFFWDFIDILLNVHYSLALNDIKRGRNTWTLRYWHMWDYLNWIEMSH